MAQRSLKHLFAIVSNHGMNLVASVMLVRIFLGHWSPTAYGEWLTLSSLAGYLVTLDIGLNSAAANEMLAGYVKHDMERFKRTRDTALAFFLVIAAGATLIAGAAVTWLPVARWIGVVQTPLPEAELVIWLLAVWVLWTLPYSILQNTYRTIGDPARTQWLQNIFYYLSLALGIIALNRSGAMWQVALWQTVPVFMMSLYVISDLWRRNRELVPGVRHARLSVLREMLKPSLGFALIGVAAAVTLQGSVFVVSWRLGGAAVAVFVTTRTLVNVVRWTVGTVQLAIWPDLTILDARDRGEMLRSIHRILVPLAGSLCAGVGAALWFEGSEIVAVWTHHRLRPDPLFLRMFLVFVVLQAPWVASSAFSISANRHQRTAQLTLAASVIGLAMSFWLVRVMGMPGLPAGLMIGEALACYHFVIQDTCKLLREPYPAFAARTWTGFLAVGLLGLAVGWLAHQVSGGPPLLRWAEVGAATVAACTGACCLFCLPHEERNILTSRAQVRFGRWAGRKAGAAA